MLSLKALPQARVHHMGERAQMGAFCLMDEHKACFSLVCVTTSGKVVGFQRDVV